MEVSRGKREQGVMGRGMHRGWVGGIGRRWIGLRSRPYAREIMDIGMGVIGARG